jgi:hypothetical protein
MSHHTTTRPLILLLLTTTIMALGACTDRREVPRLDLKVDLPAVAAQYRTSLDGGPATRAAEWRFWRRPDLLISENLASGTAEHWQRDGKAVFHYRMFHEERRGIEFMVEDLEMLGEALRWTRQALLVDPQLLARLEPDTAGWRRNHPYRRYIGTVDGTHWDITLRMDIMLPMTIESRRDGIRQRTELIAAHALDTAPWQPTPTRSYEIIDFADIGDRESDPFVRKIQGTLGIEHGDHH